MPGATAAEGDCRAPGKSRYSSGISTAALPCSKHPRITCSFRLTGLLQSNECETRIHDMLCLPKTHELILHYSVCDFASTVNVITFSVACMTDHIKWANASLESREDRQCSTRIHSIHIIGQNYRSFQAFLYFGLSESQTFVCFLLFQFPILILSFLYPFMT